MNRKNKKGVSLIMSVMLIGVLSFFAMAISISVIEGIKQSGSVNRANVAYFATEGALEKGLEKNFEGGAGQNSTQTVLFNGDPDCSAKGSQSTCDICCQSNYNSTNDPNQLLQNKCKNGCKDIFSGQAGAAAKPQTKASFKIQGTVPKITGSGGPLAPFSNNTYSIPSPGTGDASKNCDPLNPPVDRTPKVYWWYLTPSSTIVGGLFKSAVDSTTPTNPNGSVIAISDVKDHPCNWGKIKVGETVSVPLYYTDGTGAHNLIGANSTFRLRLRTPCITPSWQYCKAVNGGTDGRIQLDWTNAAGHGDVIYNYNDPVVSWMITGVSKDGTETYSLGPFVDIDKGDIQTASTLISEKSIYYALLNPLYPFVALKQTSPGTDLNGCTGPINDFLGNVGSNLDGCDSSAWAFPNREIVKPILKFSVIHGLNDMSNPKITIPYLEYQVLIGGTTGQLPPSNAYQTITGESVSGSYKQVLEVKMPQESGILEYVIQQ